MADERLVELAKEAEADFYANPDGRFSSDLMADFAAEQIAFAVKGERERIAGKLENIVGAVGGQTPADCIAELNEFIGRLRAEGEGR